MELPGKNDAIVFYVDDDREDLEIFSEIAKEFNNDLEVHTYNNGDKLLDALKNTPARLSCVFVDLNLPGTTGFEVIESIRKTERLDDMPVVILSTAEDADTIARCRALGANYYIHKSNDYKTLVMSIRHVLTINWQTFKPNEHNFVFKRNS